MAFTTVTGASGAPTTYTGTDGVDLITLVNPGASDLSAEAADDFIGINLTGTTTATSQSLRGGQGNDTFQLTGNANALISSYIAGNLGNDQMFTTGTGVNAQASTVQGGQGNDTIAVSATNGGSLINGNLGNDTLNIATGTGGGVISSASLYGGQGNDTINIGGGLTGTSTVTLAGVSIDGALGNDTINILALGAGGTNGSVSATTISGGAGEDTISAANAGAGLAATGTLFLDGGADNDIVRGSTAADSIDGGSGQDFLQGNGGGDTISGGAGNDVFNIALIGDTWSVSASGAAAGPAITTNIDTTNGGAANVTDIITSFTVGDQITFAFTDAAYTAVGGTGATGGSLANNAITNTAVQTWYGDNQVAIIRGNWNSTLNLFVASATGTDTWIAADTDSAVAAAAGNERIAGVIVQGTVVNTASIGLNSAGGVVVTYLS